MKHRLPDLPFHKNALEPHISAETLDYHHGRHHRAYVDKLNELIEGTEFERYTLEQIVRRAPPGPIYNQAAQAWNHEFFWNCLTPNSTQPSSWLLAAIERDFGSLEDFQSQFAKEAASAFGSAWAWLVLRPDSGTLAIEVTPNANNPLSNGHQPLLVCDLWEHAYYIDYRNERAKFVDGFFKVVNWDFAQKNFGSVTQSAA